MKSRNAFTLVEVLLVSSLIAVLSLAVFRSFGNGLKLWARADHLNRDAEVGIFLDKMAEDLRSTVAISNIPFKGISTEIAFPAVVMTQADVKSARSSEGFIDQIGAVRYRFDPSTHTIFRSQANYAQALKEQWLQEQVAIVMGINDLAIHYESISAKGPLL